MTVALVDTSVLLRESAGDADGTPAVSVVTIGELEVGILATNSSSERVARLRRLASLLAEAPILPVDRAVASRYSELRAATGRFASNDLWIAATALAHDLTLVTADKGQAKLPLVRTRLVA